MTKSPDPFQAYVPNYLPMDSTVQNMQPPGAAQNNHPQLTAHSTSTHRITKDISARKNTISVGVHSAIEAAARLASKEAYTNSIIQGYQDKIAIMETEKQAAIDEAVQKTRAEYMGQLQKLEKTIAEQKRAVSESKTEVKNMRIEMENKKTAYATRIRHMEKQLEIGPNSWVEFHATGKGRKKRTYVRRPTAPFNEAMAELAKDLSKSIDLMKFKVGDVSILGRDMRTLQQLGIKDGDAVDIL